MAEDFDRETEELVEQYLLFLRGRGPEPSVPNPALHRALDVLELGPARYSNSTSIPTRTVSWISADRLCQLGLVTITGRPPWHGRVELTDAGRELAASRAPAEYRGTTWPPRQRDPGEVV